MCGRYAQTGHVPTISVLIHGMEHLVPMDSTHAGNLAPTMQGTVIVLEDGVPVQRTMRWGLVPHFAKEIGTFATFNARGETVATSPAFRRAFAQQRCLVPCAGFYEWAKVEGSKKKVPHFFSLASGEPMMMAGLWDRARINGAELLSYTIVTTTPNDLVAQFHHRMAVILQQADWGTWLDPRINDIATLQGLVRPLPAELMQERVAAI